MTTFRSIAFPVLLVILLFTTVAQCSAPPVTNSDDGMGRLTEVYRVPGRDSVYRLIDKEAGVVCWLYMTYEGGGISCLPVEDTQLPGGQQ